MKITSTPALTLLLLPLFGTPASEGPTFGPEAGSEVRITFDQVSELELTGTESTFTVNGEDQDTGEAPQIEVVRNFVEHISYTEEFLEIDGDRPTRVRRTYEEIGVTSSDNVVDAEGGEHESTTEEESALEGTTVLFVWEEDDEEYTKSFGDDGGDEELLEKLNLDGYLIEFLPDGEIAEGEEWEIDASAFHILTYPGGDLSYETVDAEEEDDGSREDLDEQYRENMEGEILAEYQGTRDEDGILVAVIALTVETSTSIEQEQELEAQIGEETADGTATNTMEFEFELEGELLWDLEAGRAHSLQLSGDKTFNLTNNQQFEGAGLTIEIASSQEFEGTLELRYSFE
jgi:hypothetical protein